MVEGVAVGRGAERRPLDGTRVMLALVAVLAIAFVVHAALPYFRVTPEQFRGYWPRRWWLLLHIVTGMVALLSGPIQLGLGFAERRMDLHRVLGAVYVPSVGLSAAAAYSLAVQTDFGWVFGTGLAGLATAWLVTTGVAIVAIRRRLYDQHKEWMLRSYVVTTAFVSFRAFFLALGAAGVGTLTERLAAASWFCWAVPLLLGEAVLQGRKIFSSAESSSQLAARS
jgi:Predicted membrane protein (DUF2306)